MLKSVLVVALTSATALVDALGQQAVVSFNGSAGDLQIAGGSISAGQIMVSENDYWGVIRAAGDLALDFGRVTGKNYTLSTDSRLSSSNATASSNSTATQGSSAAVYSYNPVNNNNNTFVRPPIGPV